MKRSELTSMPAYFDRYINLCDDVTIEQATQTAMDELSAAPISTWKELGDKVYQPGKWTIKEILQHLIDTERIFSYRALTFARGEKQPLPSYEEDEYATASAANRRTLEELLEELKHLHQSVILLFQSFSKEMLGQMGMGFKGLYSVAHIGFILAGHQRWHFKIIEERYLPLLANEGLLNPGVVATDKIES